MRPGELLQSVFRVIDAAAESLPGAEWYGFGSFFSHSPCFSDVDILVVCATQEQGLAIHDLAHELCSMWPIDLLILTEAEAAETSFVEKQGCVRLNR